MKTKNNKQTNWAKRIVNVYVANDKD